MQNLLGVSVDGLWGKESSGAAGGITADAAWQAYQNDLLYPGGIVDPNDEAITNFLSTIITKDYYTSTAKKVWGPYTTYLAYEIITNDNLSDAQKDYLTNKYQIKQSDYDRLEQDGKI